MATRKEKIVSRLNTLFGELAGQDLTGSDPDGCFLELGFDSLFLTQVAGVIKRQFNVKVTFRQLLSDCTTFTALADYIDSKLPDEEATDDSRLRTVPAPNASETSESEQQVPVDSQVLQRIVKEQLRIMDLQVAVLSKATGSSLSANAKALGSKSTVDATKLTSDPAQEGQHGPYRPTNRSERRGLTADQKAYLDRLSERYVSKTPKSKEYTQRHRSRLADPRAVAGFRLDWKEMIYPIVSTRSEGPYLWDLDGNKWVDVAMGFGVALLGHSPAFITEVLKEQLDRGVEIGPQSPLAGEVSELICEFTGMDRATFCNTGSEAVMAALRICRTVTGRTKVVLFAGGYHGTFDEVLVKGAFVDGKPKTLPLAPGVAPNLISEIVVLEYGAADSLSWIREHSHELAAVLVEPVQSRHPDLQPVEFLHEVRTITRATETPLIFDEVITGFRCHPGGAQKHFGVEADLATYGKVIGGGMPFGFIAGKAWLMDAFDGGMWNYGDDSFPEAGVTFFAGTFVRHPLAMVAARAMLLHLKKEGPELQAGLASRTKELINELNQYFKHHQVQIHLEQFTSLWYPHFEPEVKFGSLLYLHLREKGLHIWEGRPCFLSTTHTNEDIEFIKQAFKQSVAEMQLGGFLPGTSGSEFHDEALRQLQHAREATDPQQSLQTGVSQSTGARSECPPTEAQREIWLASKMDRLASCAFNESCTIHLQGSLDMAALIQAIQEIVNRHEALRCSFSADGYIQNFASDLQLEIPEQDLTSLTPEEQTSQLKTLLEADAEREFDLDIGPLLRFQLIHISEQEHHLVFTVHHIACDGWSYDVILNELSQLYSIFQNGKQSALPQAMRFRDYAKLEEDLKAKELPRAASYWIGQFETPPPVLDLPTDRPRPSIRSWHGDRRSLHLKPELVAALRKMGASHGATLFTVLLSGFTTLLHRLSGQEDMVVGVPAAGQNIIGRNDLVGHCANLLPLRLTLQRESSFEELLRHTGGKVLDAYDHQVYTFGSLLNKLSLQRDPSRIPLVPVFFNLDPSLSGIDFEGLRHQIKLNPRRGYQFELGLNVSEHDGGLCVDCDYNTDLFDETTIVRWLDHYGTLLEAVSAVPTERVEQVSILGSQSRKMLLEDWNATDNSYPSDKTVHALFEEQAASTPDSHAVSFEGSVISYQELNHRANLLASELRRLKVQPETLVGICVDRSIEMVVGVLAILKSGGAYVPLDPALPSERLAMMVEDAHLTVIVAHTDTVAQLPENQAQIVLVDADYSEDASPESPADSTSHNLAYVIFTSGSTGRPKGVEIPHYALVNFLNSMRREPGLAAADVLMSVTTLSFDISALELFLPLTTGATVVIASRQTAADGLLLRQEMERTQATVIQATPVTYRLLLEAGWNGDSHLKILVGGEAVPRNLVNELAPRCASLWNVYGPTETTIWSTCCRLTKGGGPVSIGRPIDNTQVYVVNSMLEPQPIGVSGELLIGGDGLARGYLRQRDLTAEKFIPDCFRQVKGARLYRTGDLAKWLPEGRLECLGRHDHQVKIRGFRIELDEIETAILKHDSVSETVVVAASDGSGEKRLAAYWVPSSNGHAQSEQWREVWELIFKKAISEGGSKADTLENLDAIAFGWTVGSANGTDVRQEVEEWITTTVERVISLKPSRVLELGCGTGQLLLRLAPNCQEYVGTDITEAAIDALNHHLADANGAFANVRLMHRPADDFSEIKDHSFDTVILNSVAQYFPDIDYFFRVVEGAVRVTKPGGHVFLGDIQSHSLAECYQTATQLAKADENSSVAAIRKTIHQRISTESELMLDPGIMLNLQARLPGIAHVEWQLRRGRAINETTQFHYDAILTVGERQASTEATEWWDWNSDQLSMSALEERLRKSKADVIGIKGIPNGRLQPELAAFESLVSADAESDLKDTLQIMKRTPRSFDPEDLWVLGDRLDRVTRVRWHNKGMGDLLDVVFDRRDGNSQTTVAWPEDLTEQADVSALTNLSVASSSRSNHAGEFRAFLRESLPEYMVPSAFVRLDSIPRTPNGKIDRKSLPAISDQHSQDSADHIAPRTEVESKLAEIWAQVLGVERVSVTDSFFDLGGHSLLAVKLFSEIERNTGRKLSLATILKSPTVEQLAQTLEGQSLADNWNSLVNIQPKGDNPPLFLVHGAGGNVLLYRDLSRHLGIDHPVYGLQAHGLDGTTPPIETIQEMASAYIQHIKCIRNKGPYYLGGYCMGGLIAYEMAQQLRAAGEEVPFVALLDTYNYVEMGSGGRVSSLVQRLRFHTGNVVRLAPGQMFQYVKEKVRIARDGEWANLLGSQRKPSDRTKAKTSSVATSVQAGNDEAALNYRPQLYAGQITLFRPRVNYDFYPDPQMGWGDLVQGGIEIVELPVGPHAMLVEPFVQMLARELTAKLNDTTTNSNLTPAGGSAKQPGTAVA